ncbi:NAD(P)/FAD-dependent oxidoreductase [Sporolituus thermophilus]|uniref:Thioredoxin reductase n=1 Tax=Sporolituus thermophilus DSM 23256 TaxID=1123285 RepID=A0A1G7L8P5_9FIRM|nr:FAD-dependent oxidoreductase [Sporolituus thermophilus]SDF45922.1 Thioredoxin reductase [Sporolituus thermophilus DSM 23256]
MTKSSSTLCYDVAIIGGGPAGLAAALSARQTGAEKVLIIERDREPGGILQQCIHNGFGLHRFHEELTGPGYAHRFIKMVADDPKITVMLDTMALEVSPDKTVWAVNPQAGLVAIHAKAVVFAMGCRERTRGAIRIPGYRPAGVFTAGAAQRMVNMEGYLPGKRVVILGSGDIGLIMARRMTLEGAKVEAVIEIMPYSNGLTRNIVQCLEDYGIPLYLSHTITFIHGRERVTGVTVAKVDKQLSPIPGSEFDIACDCILLSVGLIPENELSRAAGVAIDNITGGPIVDQFRHTSLSGFFAAGNVVHVHDLVDFVSEEGDIAGKYAARYARGELAASAQQVSVLPGDGIRSVVPQRLTLETASDPVRLFLRVAKPAKEITLQMISAGKILLERRLPVAKPSEMIVIELPADKLQTICEQIEIKAVKSSCAKLNAK